MDSFAQHHKEREVLTVRVRRTHDRLRFSPDRGASPSLKNSLLEGKTQNDDKAPHCHAVTAVTMRFPGC